MTFILFTNLLSVFSIVRVKLVLKKLLSFKAENDKIEFITLKFLLTGTKTDFNQYLNKLNTQGFSYLPNLQSSFTTFFK